MKKLNRLTCAETFRRLDDYIDRALRPHETRLVEQHLATCAECAGEYRFEGRWIEELRNKVQRMQLPHGLMERIVREVDKLEARGT